MMQNLSHFSLRTNYVSFAVKQQPFAVLVAGKSIIARKVAKESTGDLIKQHALRYSQALSWMGFLCQRSH
jgi:hypothetical protein